MYAFIQKHVRMYPGMCARVCSVYVFTSVHICVYVCVYDHVCIPVPLCAYVHGYVNIWLYDYMYVYVFIWTGICLRVYVYVYACIPMYAAHAVVRLCQWIYVYTRMHIFAVIRTCFRERAFICILTYTAQFVNAWMCECVYLYMCICRYVCFIYVRIGCSYYLYVCLGVCGICFRLYLYVYVCMKYT